MIGCCSYFVSKYLCYFPVISSYHWMRPGWILYESWMTSGWILDMFLMSSGQLIQPGHAKEEYTIPYNIFWTSWAILGHSGQFRREWWCINFWKYPQESNIHGSCLQRSGLVWTISAFIANLTFDRMCSHFRFSSALDWKMFCSSVSDICLSDTTYASMQL